jgi:hypothetical protein
MLVLVLGTVSPADFDSDALRLKFALKGKELTGNKMILPPKL